MIYSVLVMAVVALVYAYWLARKTFAADMGTAEMQRIWGYIRGGANTYLRTQMKTIAILIVVLTIAMFLSVALAPPTGEANELFCAQAVKTALAENIAANTNLTSVQALALLETETAQSIAHAHNYTTMRPDRIAASVSCQTAVWGVGHIAVVSVCDGGDLLGHRGFCGHEHGRARECARGVCL
ncbi:MAG: sodium/proton-translocating pyrophosphatase [Chloroflexi bacterium]|nr:sodium/proton-translocating pyrophosphatase [Chloroflexota bacterium]